MSFQAQIFPQMALDRMEKAAIERDAPGGERSMQKTVDIFRAYTGIELTEEDGWRFMICLKMAREIQGMPKPDDYVDLIGYSSLLGESLLQDKIIAVQPKKPESR